MADVKPILSGELEELAAQFYAECAKGRLAFQRCRACRAWRHLPRHICASCGSAAWEWSASSGRGRLFSWTVTHQAPFPLFRDATPYAVAVVEMEEGVRLVGALRGLALERLALDLPVVVEFERVSDAAAVPVFRPA
jgi:uncharacterized OB-fold protein